MIKKYKIINKYIEKFKIKIISSIQKIYNNKQTNSKISIISPYCKYK